MRTSDFLPQKKTVINLVPIVEVKLPDVCKTLGETKLEALTILEQLRQERFCILENPHSSTKFSGDSRNTAIIWYCLSVQENCTKFTKTYQTGKTILQQRFSALTWQEYRRKVVSHLITITGR